MISRHTTGYIYPIIFITGQREQTTVLVLVSLLLLALERIWHGNERTKNYLWSTRFSVSFVFSQSFYCSWNYRRSKTHLQLLLLRAAVLLARVNKCTNTQLQISGKTIWFTSAFNAVCNNCYRLA